MDKPPKSVSRRQAVGYVGLGLASAAASSAMAQQAEQHVSTRANGSSKEDPREKYPKPPFEEQTQPWPGLAGKMNPKPDHGETSYHGSGRLAGRKALITGGDSGMGRAAAIAYAREGADVAINYLPAEEPDAREVIQLIKEAGRKGVPIPGDLRDQAFCQRLVAEAIQKLGGLDIVVCNAGRQQSKPSILDITAEDFDATMKTNIYAPFWIIKAALPHLQPGSCIIGTASEQAYDPSPELYDYAQTKGSHDELRQISGQATRTERNSRERRGPRTDLDAAADQRRRIRAEVRALRQHHGSWQARAARRARIDLRPTCSE